jgi:hypothetical protein
MMGCSIRNVGEDDMTVIALSLPLPRLRVHWLIWVGLIGALVAAMVAAFPFEVLKECRGGAFSAGFSREFDVRRCDLVVRRGAYLMARIRLPAAL